MASFWFLFLKVAAQYSLLMHNLPYIVPGAAVFAMKLDVFMVQYIRTSCIVPSAAVFGTKLDVFA